MKNNPLATVCIFFCLGIWVAKVTHIPLFLLCGAVFLSLSAALLNLKKNLFFCLFLGASIFLSGTLHLKNSQLHPSNHVINYICEEPQIVYARGRVVSNPEVSFTSYHTRKTAFTFGASDLKIGQRWHDTQGLIKVDLYGQRQVRLGDELLLQGSLVQPMSLRNPGGFDYREHLANQRIFGTLRVKQGDLFRLTSSDKTFSKNIFRLKQSLRGTIYGHLEPEQAVLLSAILLGERSRLTQDIKDLFINTGTVHILPIQSRKKSSYSPKSNLTL